MRHFLVVATTSLCLSFSAHAQTDERQEALAAVEACRAIANKTVSAACLSAATDLLNSLPDTPAAPEAAPITPSTPQALSEDTLEAERNRLEIERAALEAERAALSQQRAVLAEAAAEEERKKEIREARIREGGLLARLDASFDYEQNGEPIEITITKITIDNRKNRHFHTSEGDILTEQHTGSKRSAPRDLPAAAVLGTSTLGAKWIAFNSRPNRRFKVKVPRRR